VSAPLRRLKRSFWSNVAAVAYKEGTVIRHDRALLGTVLAQPVMMLLLFGFALSNKPANVPWAVLDQSRSPVSRRLIADVQATGYFLPPRFVDSYTDGRALLRGGEALALLVFPPSLRRDLERGGARVQLLLDGSDPLSAARVGGYITEVTAASVAAPTELGSRDPEAAVRRVGGTIDVRQRFWFNSTLRDRDFFLAALAGMLLTNLCLSATSLGLVAEREAGTYEQMLALPTTPIVAPTIEEMTPPDVFARKNAMLLRNTSIWNFFDCCAISLPLPRDGGLPVGLMLVARNGHDHRLFRIAAAVERLLAA